MVMCGGMNQGNKSTVLNLIKRGGQKLRFRDYAIDVKTMTENIAGSKLGNITRDIYDTEDENPLHFHSVLRNVKERNPEYIDYIPLEELTPQEIIETNIAFTDLPSGIAEKVNKLYMDHKKPKMIKAIQEDLYELWKALKQGKLDKWNLKQRAILEKWGDKGAEYSLNMSVQYEEHLLKTLYFISPNDYMRQILAADFEHLINSLNKIFGKFEQIPIIGSNMSMDYENIMILFREDLLSTLTNLNSFSSNVAFSNLGIASIFLQITDSKLDKFKILMSESQNILNRVPPFLEDMNILNEWIRLVSSLRRAYIFNLKATGSIPSYRNGTMHENEISKIKKGLVSNIYNKTSFIANPKNDKKRHLLKTHETRALNYRFIFKNIFNTLRLSNKKISKSTAELKLVQRPTPAFYRPLFSVEKVRKDDESEDLAYDYNLNDKDSYLRFLNAFPDSRVPKSKSSDWIFMRDFENHDRPQAWLKNFEFEESVCLYTNSYNPEFVRLPNTRIGIDKREQCFVVFHSKHNLDIVFKNFKSLNFNDKSPTIMELCLRHSYVGIMKRIFDPPEMYEITDEPRNREEEGDDEENVVELFLTTEEKEKAKREQNMGRTIPIKKEDWEVEFERDHKEDLNKIYKYVSENIRDEDEQKASELYLVSKYKQLHMKPANLDIGKMITILLSRGDILSKMDLTSVITKMDTPFSVPQITKAKFMKTQVSRGKIMKRLLNDTHLYAELESISAGLYDKLIEGKLTIGPMDYEFISCQLERISALYRDLPKAVAAYNILSELLKNSVKTEDKARDTLWANVNMFFTKLEKGLIADMRAGSEDPSRKKKNLKTNLEMNPNCYKKIVR